VIFKKQSRSTRHSVGNLVPLFADKGLLLSTKQCLFYQAISQDILKRIMYIYIYIQKICDYVICLKIYNMYEVVGKRAEFTGRDFQVEVSAGFL